MKLWKFAAAGLILVFLYGCGGPALYIGPDQLAFGPRDTHKVVKLANTGSGDLDWRISDDQSWLSVRPFSGITGGDTVSLTVIVDRSSLDPGKYNGELRINSNGGDTTISVSVIKLRNPVVEMETSMGKIKLELFPDVAPVHVLNFLNLARSGFYDSLIFHRVIDGFMIQGGGFTSDNKSKRSNTIPAEFNDSLHNAGTLAMARAMDVNSASSQFYICLQPHHELDYNYTVFGKTIEGMDVVKAIGNVETNRGNKAKGSKLMQDQPLKPVYIKKVSVLVDYESVE